MGFRRTLLRRLGEEHGIALIMAVQFLAITAIAGSSVVYYATQNANSSTAALADQKAFALAEAAFNTAYSILANSSTPSSPSALPSAANPGSDSTTHPGGTIQWWGSYDSSTSTWTITGRGLIGASGGTRTIVRTVSQQARIAPGTPTVASNPAWNYIFADNLNRECLTLESSVQISEPIYATGDLCLESSAKILRAAGSVTVAGKINLISSSKIGESSAYLPQLRVAGGCRYGIDYGQPGAYSGPPCTTGQHVWATTQDANVPAVTKPPVDLPYWYVNAKPGPLRNCTTGSFPGGFDNNTIMNVSRSNVNLLPANSSYDCTVIDNGATVGRIAWNANTKAFVIEGVVFFDAHIWMAGSQPATYTGRGTIYAAGSIYLGSSDQFCASRSAGQCNYTSGWNPETTLLALVAGGDVTITSSVQFQGAIYATGDYFQGSSVKAQGPIIANNIHFDSSSQVPWTPFTTLARGMPAVSGAPVLSLLSGTWSG